MIRKEYEEPTMKVVKLRHTGMLMVSGVEAQRTDYGEANVSTWEDGE